MGENKLRQEGEEILDLLRSISHNMREVLLKEAKKTGLGVQEFNLLRELKREGGLSLNILSQKLDLPKSTVSRLVDVLVKKGAVKREIPENNRRTVKLWMAPVKGTKYNFKNAAVNHMSESLTKKKAFEIISMLKDLKKITEKIN
ncbi:MAG: MarR family transcriptional regulator [bacterium]